VRGAGTRWPSRGRSSGVRRNVDTRGAGEREGPAVSEASRVQDAVGRMWQRRGGRSHVVREVRRCDDSGRTRPGGSRAARRRGRRPLRRRQLKRPPHRRRLKSVALSVPGG
jgi:hypothetical protein